MSRISFRLDPLFLVLAFGIGWLNSPSIEGIFLWAAVIFVSILIHELGHAFTAMSFGQTVQVTFMPLGGLTSRMGEKLSPFKEFLIVLNGPLAGFALYFICRYFLQSFGGNSSSPVAYMLLIGTWVNLVWTVINLFPVLPLDGGRLLMIICEKMFGVKGQRIAYGLSFVFSIVFAVFFFLIQELFAGAIFSLFAFESYRGFNLGKHAAPIDEDEGIKKDLQTAIETYNKGHLTLAINQFSDIREKTKMGMLYLLSTFYLAKALEDQGSFEEAYALLKQDEEKLDVEGLEVLQRLAFLTKHYKEAASIGVEVFREKPSADVAFINALSLAQVKEVVPAVGWFETAIRGGLENPKLSSRHLAFDPIRNTEPFKNLMARYSG